MLWVGILSVVSVIIIFITHLVHKWGNPKCNGVLPPGSMGLPLIGETLELISPSYSFQLSPFIEKRLKSYGLIFKTNVAGRPLIVSADPDFNYYLFQRDGKLVQSWYLDTFGEIFVQGESKPDGAYIHKYVRNLALHHIGVESIKGKLLTQMEELVRKTLSAWSQQESTEVKSATALMTLQYGAMLLFSYDTESSPEKLSDLFKNMVQGLMSIPVNIPGTTHHKCMKNYKKIGNVLRGVLKNRQMSPEKNKDDLLGHIISDMATEKFLTDDFVVQLSFGLLYANSDTLSTSAALAFKLLTDNPLALEELIAEHESIIKRRENPDSPITWEEYKSMTFTIQVINEILRLANITPGLFRKALEDIPINGYTIPAGWTILIASSALHLNSNKYEDPLAFNPWRWKDLQSDVISKNFMPFGSGMRQCAGADYTRVLLAVFFHVLVTKYRWTKIKGCEIVRAPIMKFPNGFHFKISEKNGRK